MEACSRVLAGRSDSKTSDLLLIGAYLLVAVVRPLRDFRRGSLSMPVFGRTAFSFKLFAGSSLSGYPDFEDLYENYDRVLSWQRHHRPQLRPLWIGEGERAIPNRDGNYWRRTANLPLASLPIACPALASNASAIRRPNGAGSLRRSDLIRNSVSAPAQGPELRQRKNSESGFSRARLRAQPRPPGTEFLDAETKRQKPSFERANADRDQNPGNE